MELTEMNRDREQALATALRIDSMVRRGIETRDNILAMFGLDGQIPSPAGGDAASQVILPPLADLDPDEPKPVHHGGTERTEAGKRNGGRKPVASTQATLDAIKRGLPTAPVVENAEAELEPATAPVRKAEAKPARGSLSGVALAAKLPATFKAAHIVALTGCTEKAAFGAIYRMRADGLAENISLGAWKNLAMKKGESCAN